MHIHKTWDLPLRLFHWLLVASVSAAFITAQIGGNLMVWHGRLGVLIAGLLGFRLVWGLVGSTHARFASFVRGPAAIKAYLAGRWPETGGHNPLGALSVLALIGILAFQTGTGLLANDDISFNGPLFDLVSKETSDTLTKVHHLGEKLVMLLVGLHLAAIVFYGRVKGHKLVGPMITGRKESALPLAVPTGGGLLALVLAVGCGLAVAYGASGAWMPAPPPPPAAAPAAPAW